MSLHQLAANALWKFGKRPVWLSIFPSSLQFTLLCEITNKSTDVEMQLFLLARFLLLQTGPVIAPLAVWLFALFCSLSLFWGDNVATILSLHSSTAQTAAGQSNAVLQNTMGHAEMRIKNIVSLFRKTLFRQKAALRNRRAPSDEGESIPLNWSSAVIMALFVQFYLSSTSVSVSSCVRTCI